MASSDLYGVAAQRMREGLFAAEKASLRDRRAFHGTHARPGAGSVEAVTAHFRRRIFCRTSCTSLLRRRMIWLMGIFVMREKVMTNIAPQLT